MARAAYQYEVRGSRRLEPRLQELVQLEVNSSCAINACRTSKRLRQKSASKSGIFLSQLDALRGAIALKTQLELDKSCALKF